MKQIKVLGFTLVNKDIKEYLLLEDIPFADIIYNTPCHDFTLRKPGKSYIRQKTFRLEDGIFIFEDQDSVKILIDKIPGQSGIDQERIYIEGDSVDGVVTIFGMMINSIERIEEDQSLMIHFTPEFLLKYEGADIVSKKYRKDFEKFNIEGQRLAAHSVLKAIALISDFYQNP